MQGRGQKADFKEKTAEEKLLGEERFLFRVIQRVYHRLVAGQLTRPCNLPLQKIYKRIKPVHADRNLNNALC